MDLRTCAKCGARWMEGQHYWSTGAQGNEADLAGLVCNNLKPGEESECINPLRGDASGTNWEYRRGMIDGIMTEFDRAMKSQGPEA